MNKILKLWACFSFCVVIVVILAHLSLFVFSRRPPIKPLWGGKNEIVGESKRKSIEKSKIKHEKHNESPLKWQDSQGMKEVSGSEASDFSKLNTRYCIQYGNPDAQLKVIEFFSFQCPHCVKLFNDDFFKIKKELIDTEQVSFTFHPVPQDLSTVQALICMECLSEIEKQLFLEAMFEESVPSDQELMAKLMMTAMNVFKKPIAQLEDKTFIQNHAAFDEVFQFLKQKKVLAVPTVEINGSLFPAEVPSFQFIQSFLKGQ